MNFNKLKLILHRASMKYYENYLKKNGIEVYYHEFNNLEKDKKYKSIPHTTNWFIFTLTDHYLTQKIEKNFRLFDITCEYAYSIDDDVFPNIYEEWDM
jgi:deoxyribodipyrimidine photolyase-related protein